MATATPEPIQLDLRRDLPKVRAAYDELIEKIGGYSCFYSAPCAIGAMMAPEQRRRLAVSLMDSTPVRDLLGDVVIVPAGQDEDFITLQGAFDGGDSRYFPATLAELEAKYLTA